MLSQITLLLAVLQSVRAAVPVTRGINQRAVTQSSKAGLAWPNGNSVDIKQFLTTGKVSWYHTWSPWPVETDIEFVPLLWGQRQVGDWNQTIQETIQKLKPTAVLGMNEPQEKGQSNISPEEGAVLWKTYIEPLKAAGLRLGSPAPSSAPSGKEWLLSWLNSSCSDCHVDFIALHWYDINATAFMNYLTDFHDTFQRPIWVTEWTCQNYNNVDKQCSYQEIVDFMNATQSFMDNTEWVERYSWFGAMENLQGVNTDDALMTPKGEINSLGQQYIGGNTSNAPGPSSSSGNGSGPQITSGSSNLIPRILYLVILLITLLMV